MRSNYLFYLFDFTLKESDGSHQLWEPAGSFSSWSETVNMNSFHTCVYQKCPLPRAPRYPSPLVRTTVFSQALPLGVLFPPVMGEAQTPVHVACSAWPVLTNLVFPAIMWSGPVFTFHGMDVEKEAPRTEYVVQDRATGDRDSRQQCQCPHP